MGEAASLGAAMLWALAIALFRPSIRSHGAPVVNLLKCGVATLLLGATVLAAGQTTVFADASAWHLTLIAISAWIGLTLGDTFLFVAVARIGPYRAVLLQTLSPVFAASLALAWLGERPTLHQTAGAVVVLLAIVLVLRPSRRDRRPKLDRRVLLAGIGFATLGAMGQGFGIVFAKEGMDEVPFLAAAFLRMLAGTLGLLLLTASGGARRAWRVLRSREGVRVAGASFLGSYLAIALMMAGVFYAPAAVAAVLLATVPLFAMFVDAVTLGEPITARGMVGTVAAVLGVLVLST